MKEDAKGLVKNVNEGEILALGALPPDVMKGELERMFAKHYAINRAELPRLVSNHAVIVEMLKNPVWEKWANCRSYQVARKILDRQLPGWNADEEVIEAAATGDELPQNI